MSALQEPSSLPPALARVLVVDDQEEFRAILCRLVDVASGIALLAVADSGEGAVAAAHELEPDMVVIDVVMPGIGGIDAARTIKAERPTTVVVLVSTTHPDDLPSEAEESRADEIVWKSELRPSVLESIWLRHAPGSY